MHNNYKLEERIIKNIIMKNTKCIDENEKLQIIFYYRNRKTANLVIKNSQTTQVDPLKTTNVIYKYTCNLMTSQLEYIGITKTTFKEKTRCTLL